VLGCALSLSCGGGDETTLTGLAATFMPVSATPPAGSVTLQAGPVSGEAFHVRVAATDVNDFFGAAFRVSYQNTIVSFTGMDSSGSFLRETGVTTDFRVDSTTELGTLIILATRLQQNPPIPGVNVVGTRDLLTLSFFVRSSTAGSRIDFATVPAPVVCDSGQPVCTPITVTEPWPGGIVVAN